MQLAGTPSDDVDGILATGHGDITTLFVSMSARHADGADADYVQWHSLDHRPEQHRLAAVRSSLRLVSTPACRAARAVSDARLDAVDHVMTYFFASTSGFKGFADLSAALHDAGRMPYSLPPVERGAYEVREARAAPRCKLGADVLPWFPASGAYVLVEHGDAHVDDLVDVPGVAGAWSAVAVPSDPSVATAEIGQRITYCFLDADPVGTAELLRPVLERRWQNTAVTPLLAAPFHSVVPGEWDRYLP
jgi:hypothetical protein